MCAYCATGSVNYHPIQAITDAPPRPRAVIAFTGLAGSGKSTAARHLINAYAYQRGKFAGALKEMMRALLRYRGVDATTIERMIEGDLKEVASPHLNGRTPRHAMQTLGTEWGRDCVDKNLWVDTEMDATAGAAALVFDDVRFPNEAAAIRAAGGTIVRIVRPEQTNAAAGHSSEGQELAADVTIHNRRSVGHMLEEVGALARDLSWAQASF